MNDHEDSAWGGHFRVTSGFSPAPSPVPSTDGRHLKPPLHDRTLDRVGSHEKALHGINSAERQLNRSSSAEGFGQFSRQGSDDELQFPLDDFANHRGSGADGAASSNELSAYMATAQYAPRLQMFRSAYDTGSVASLDRDVENDLAQSMSEFAAFDEIVMDHLVAVDRQLRHSGQAKDQQQNTPRQEQQHHYSHQQEQQPTYAGELSSTSQSISVENGGWARSGRGTPISGAGYGTSPVTGIQNIPRDPFVRSEGRGSDGLEGHDQTWNP